MNDNNFDSYTGVVRTFYNNGKLKEEYYMNSGKEEGLYKDYHEINGNLSREINCVNGKINGIFKQFYPNGNIYRESIFMNDESIEDSFYNIDGIKI